MATLYLSSGRIDYKPAKIGGTGRAKAAIKVRQQKDATFNELFALGERLNKTASNNTKRNEAYKAKRAEKKTL